MSEPSVTLHLGDCLEVMRGMADGSVDAVVTDPPFGVRAEAWDDMQPREYARFCMAWLSEVRRISREAVIFTTQDNAIIPLCEMLWRRTRRMIWHKPPGSQYAGASECGVWYAFEVVLHCHDRETWSVVEPRDAEVGRLIRRAREAAGLSRGGVDFAIRGKKTGLCYRWEEGACLPSPDQVRALKSLLDLGDEFDEAMGRAGDIKSRTVDAARQQASRHAARNLDVFTHRTVTDGVHPCQKPDELMAEVIEAVGQDYRRVLDPFMGSGATGVACVLADRKFIGCEINPDYHAIAARRIAEAESRDVLFRRPAESQVPLFAEDVS